MNIGRKREGGREGGREGATCLSVDSADVHASGVVQLLLLLVGREEGRGLGQGLGSKQPPGSKDDEELAAVDIC